jgi:predicted LPLAT superfamily acyltransferase
MASWKGKSRGNLLGYRIFFFTLRVFGLRGGYTLLRFVTFYYFLFALAAVKAQMQYFKQVHGYSGLKSWWAAYRNLNQFGQSLIDKAVVQSGRFEKPFEIIREGEPFIAEALEKGKGVLLISAHVGNWEAAGQLLNKFNTTVNLVMLDAEHEQLKTYLATIMSERRLNIIPIKNDLSHVIAIKQAFDRNEIVALHGDRYTEAHRVERLPFFGSDAAFPMGPFILSSKFKVPTLYVFCMKEQPLQYHFYAYQSGEEGDKPEMLLQRFVTLLSQKVKDYPHQWYNYYDFWQSTQFNEKYDDHPGRKARRY